MSSNMFPYDEIEYIAVYITSGDGIAECAIIEQLDTIDIFARGISMHSLMN